MRPVIKLRTWQFAIPTTVNLKTQALRHILGKDPLLRLAYPVALCSRCKLGRIIGGIGGDQNDIQFWVTLFKHPQHFQLSRAVLTLERPENKNEGSILAGCKYLRQTAGNEGANIVRRYGYA